MSGGMFQVGEVLAGTYRIERPLGAGGMGAVFIASHVRLPKQYAIKTLHSQIGKDPMDAARFRQEAEIASRLHHPHIVEVHDFNTTEDGTNYIVMELLEGRDLGTLIAKEGRLPPARALAIVRDVSDALAAAHARGVVHRDLKPSNIFLAERAGREVVKILDFGISKQAGSTDVRTLTSELIGTPAYMSPEQARSRNHEVDGRSDQFSLAAIVYEMLGGKRAFGEAEDSVFDVLERVVHEDPPPLQGVSPAVNAVLARGLQKARDKRFPGVWEFFRALEEAMGPEGAAALTTTGPPAPAPAAAASPAPSPGERSASVTGHIAAPAPARSRAPLVAVGVGLVIAAGVVAAVWSGRGPAGDSREKLGAAAAPDLGAPARNIAAAVPPPDAAVAPAPRPDAAPPAAHPTPPPPPPTKRIGGAPKTKTGPRPHPGGVGKQGDDLEDVFNKK